MTVISTPRVLRPNGRRVVGICASQATSQELKAMDDAAASAEATPLRTEHFDVLIVGAGISGIGGAFHLSKQCPGTRFVVLELEGKLRRYVAHPSLPGHPIGQRPAYVRLSLQAMARRTDCHRSPDHQLHGRSHRRERPRPAHSLSAPDFLGKLVEQENRWTITATRTDTGETVRFTANFLWMCQGYYRHSEGYTPHWDGMEPSRAGSFIRKPGRRTWTTATRRSS